jgi:membrane protein DedA with SNARE-associated domain
MPDLAQLLGHWGYLALFVVVVLGNLGVPLPEESVLALAGYLVWRGDMRLPVVLVVGVVSAVAGDNLGYWLGHRFGRNALPRYARWVLGHPERLSAMESFIVRRGPFAVFVARFIPGIRFMAGPLAGGLGMRFAPFLAANVLGALIYVPTAVGAGYAIGYGLGEYVERLQRTVGEAERVILAAVIVGALAFIAWRVVHAVRGQKRPVI